jgi:hypothetical protein
MKVAYLLIFLISIAICSYIPNIYSQQYYWSENDQWSYNITINGTIYGIRDFVVNKITTYKQQTVFEINDSTNIQGNVSTMKIYMSIDLKRIREETQSNNYTIEVYYSPYLTFVNLQNNQVKDWTSQSTVVITENGSTYANGMVILNAKVLGVEIVNLPAGKFSAYKIDFFENVTLNGSEGDVTFQITVTQKGTVWYSTQVKQYIKEDIVSNTTVTSTGNPTRQSQTSYLTELKSYSIQQQTTSTTSSPTVSTTTSNTSPSFTFTKTSTSTSSSSSILSSTPFSYSSSTQSSSPLILTSNELTIFGLSMLNFILILLGVIIPIALVGLLFRRRRKRAPPKVVYPTQPPPPQPPQYTQSPQYGALPTQYPTQYQTQPQPQATAPEQVQPSQQPVPSTKVCPYCNSILPAEAKFCAVCGNPQPK